MSKNANSPGHLAPVCQSESTPQPSPQAKALDNNFRNSIANLRRDLVRTIYYLRLIYDLKVYRLMGYQNIRHYASKAGGLNESQCKAFLKIGAKLGDLPQMKRALEEGSLSWRKAEIIVGQADELSEAELIETARSLSTVELKRPSAEPKAPPYPPPSAKPMAKRTEVRPEDEPCYISYKLTPEQYSIWAAILAAQNRSKEELLMEALEAYGENRNEAKNNEGRHGPGYLIVLQECPDCGRGTLANNRGTFQAPQALLESARCDALIEDSEARRKRVIPPRLRRMVLKRDQYRCQAEGCPNTLNLQMHHRIPIAQGGKTDLANIVTLCRRCHRRLHQVEEALRIANRDPAN